MVTQAQQDVLNLLLPPPDIIPEIIAILRQRHQDGVTARALCWATRINEFHEENKHTYIIGSVSDTELQELWDMAETADLWASIV
jgi:hypothetical protein